MIQSILTSARRAARSLGRRAQRPVSAPVREYSIGMYAGSSAIALTPSAAAANPVITRRDVSDVPASLVADPFMIGANDQWYMFFEVFNTRSKKGEIGLATSADALTWRYRHIVLCEAFHLSYPCVFQWQGAYYMTPESHKTGEVKLYKAVDFPSAWAHEATLVGGSAFVDPSPFLYRNRWWLFTGGGARPMRADVLRLHHAPELTGPWREHPCSPIYTNAPRAARPAGRVVVSGGRLIRYAQDCVPSYGSRVRVFEIVELTETSYRERPALDVPLLEGSRAGWNADGMHHIDPHRVDDARWIACADGWSEQAS